MSAVMRDADFAMCPMREEDLPAVMWVETAVYPYPWTEGIFRDCLRVDYCCWVFGGPKRSSATGSCRWARASATS